ncbi:MAG TPA: hypothetical protein VJQ57_09290 [Acidimicrobiia bacterium]|nr:hypothetical protein [Acidimicrobiia bacterium]
MRSVAVSASGAVACDSYWGFSLRETSGSASAKVIIHKGTDNTGTALDVVNLTANESAREVWSVAESVGPLRSLYVEVVSGAVSGNVKVG